MKFTWIIKDLFTVDKGSETNYVVTALCDVTAEAEVDGKIYTQSSSLCENFEVVQGDTFIPYADLTNEIVVGWIKSKLGEDGVLAVNNSLAESVSDQINPPVIPTKTDLPWS